MTVTVQEIDIFETPATVPIIHQCNCHGVMGKGLAKKIRARYPEAYAEDLLVHAKRCRGGVDPSKLGTFSTAVCLGGDLRRIYNMYGQLHFYGPGPKTNYDAVDKALRAIAEHAISLQCELLAIPYQMGCGYGGGTWHVVRSIINSIFTKDGMPDILICRHGV